MGVVFTYAHPQEVNFAEKVNHRSIRQNIGVCGLLQVPGKELSITYGCGLAIATPTGSCFGY